MTVKYGRKMIPLLLTVAKITSGAGYGIKAVTNPVSYIGGLTRTAHKISITPRSSDMTENFKCMPTACNGKQIFGSIFRGGYTPKPEYMPGSSFELEGGCHICDTSGDKQTGVLCA